MKTNEEKKPVCKLVGTADGNVFSIIGKVSQTLGAEVEREGTI